MHVFYKQLFRLLQLEYFWSHKFSVWKLPSSCLLNPLSACGWLIISATLSINFQIAFRFPMSLSSIFLFSIQQITAVIAEM